MGLGPLIRRSPCLRDPARLGRPTALAPHKNIKTDPTGAQLYQDGPHRRTIISRRTPLGWKRRWAPARIPRIPRWRKIYHDGPRPAGEKRAHLYRGRAVPRAGDSSSPSSPIGQGREYDVRCDMSHLKSRFNKFVRDRSIKAHGRGHRRLSEPAAQRRQVRQGLRARAEGARARARAPRTTARRRRSPVGPHVLPGVRQGPEPQVHLR